MAPSSESLGHCSHLTSEQDVTGSDQSPAQNVFIFLLTFGGTGSVH